MLCENCQKEHNEFYGSGRFCSSKCARGFSTKSKRQEINQKVSKKIKQKFILEKGCLFCNRIFVVKRKGQKFCSNECSINSLNQNSKHYGRLGGLKSNQSTIRRSKNEVLFYEMCKDYFNNVKHNKPIFNGWDADIIIEDIKVAVLWNGKWHYEKLAEGHNLDQVKNRDKIKLKEIKKCGWETFIIKDMGKFNPDFVEENFNKFLKLYF